MSLRTVINSTLDCTWHKQYNKSFLVVGRGERRGGDGGRGVEFEGLFIIIPHTSPRIYDNAR